MGKSKDSGKGELKITWVKDPRKGSKSGGGKGKR